ncbi:unnamed protein product [Symbiodinium microadriaticum]|nr:unnamed protein product [Symbiodinium microadriaticum]
MTDLYIDISPIPMAGLGVFTKKAFKKGEVVSISPVIVVPRHSVEKISQKTLLLNYLVCSEGSDGAMLPFGIAGMANHGGVKANVKIEWHQWDALDGKEPPVNHLDWDISKLEALPFAPLDFKYVALRDIAEGEELLLSYGEQWERAWMRYLGEMKVWIEKNGVSSIALKPQFREPITAPKGFFPPNFDADCIGATGCKKSRANKRSKNPVKSQFVDAPDIELAREYAKSNFNVLVLDEL